MTNCGFVYQCMARFEIQIQEFKLWFCIVLFSINRLRHGDTYAADCVTIGPGNGLSPASLQAIIFTNADLLWIGPTFTYV